MLKFFFDPSIIIVIKKTGNVKEICHVYPLKNKTFKRIRIFYSKNKRKRKGASNLVKTFFKLIIVHFVILVLEISAFLIMLR